MSTNNGKSQSLDKALQLLECFSDVNFELRVSDFCKMLNMSQSSVSRLINTLADRGFVEKNDFSGAYYLGKKVISLAGISLNNYEIRKQALPELHNLENKTNLSANLAILDHTKMFYLAHVDSKRSPKMYTLVGYTNPLHSTGIGKVLLAHLDDEELNQIVNDIPLTPYTIKTIDNKQKLLKELELTRKRGYAIELEELALGRACIAAPVRNRSGKVVAGVSLSGPLSEIRLEEQQEELAKILIEATDLISIKMGFMHSPSNLSEINY
ncbi:IclR family transcriptional regulator [Halalkalibacter oceani]|uniref:IclR family transcriptional regulator n=1 Tax=Halalkalibacter oceani TaxID=1653776 RepID=UPI00203C2745|nr:IclR family transcriptional regulator [Halalkalibacter oceani]MCM3760336.1 IclR family transcriptional regulator [Halalkalibacter oceani]